MAAVAHREIAADRHPSPGKPCRVEAARAAMTPRAASIEFERIS
jgi:hypothetical protein